MLPCRTDLKTINLTESWLESLGWKSAHRKDATYEYNTRDNTTEKCRYTSMNPVGLKPTIPMFELAKTFNALDGTATRIGSYCSACA
jgi:hypothetical protein